MHIKTVIALISALPLTIGVEVLKYIYQDWEFAKWIGVAIAVDTTVSLVKHWLHKDISSEEFWHKFAKKIFIYIVLLISSNFLTNYTVRGHVVGATQWVGEYLCVFMLIREGISILENANAIIPIVPVWLLKRLKDFNDNGEYIKGKGHETDN
jgi:phage-related holin